jgi:hypothetical protein
MSFDGIAEAAARRLAKRPTRRKALGLLVGAGAAIGLGFAGKRMAYQGGDRRSA